MQVITINLKRDMDLKEITMRYMGRLGGRKRRKNESFYYIIIIIIIISKRKTNN